MAKKTKEQMIKEVVKVHENELKRNYVKGLAKGHELALRDILELCKKPDFDIKTYCEQELKLRSGLEKGLDVIYDKEKEKIGKEG